MSRMNRIVLIRHGETVGESSIRFHGSGDVALSDEGRAQMRVAASQIHGEGFGIVVASPLQRAWAAAAIIAPGRAVRLEHDFCEIDFGRWEGLTRQEIAAKDPVLYEQWQAAPKSFDFPEGEARLAFLARVHRGLDRLLASPHFSAIVVAHKGIVRGIVSKLSRTLLEADDPPLGGVVQLTRGANGAWRLGRRGSNPATLGDPTLANLD